jgi:hypothetical protein
MTPSIVALRFSSPVSGWRFLRQHRQHQARTDELTRSPASVKSKRARPLAPRLQMAYAFRCILMKTAATVSTAPSMRMSPIFRQFLPGAKRGSGESSVLPEYTVSTSRSAVIRGLHVRRTAASVSRMASSRDSSSMRICNSLRAASRHVIASLPLATPVHIQRAALRCSRHRIQPWPLRDNSWSSTPVSARVRCPSRPETLRLGYLWHPFSPRRFHLALQ